MKPDKFACRKVTLNEKAIYEINCITDEWDEREFIPTLDETLYLHLINLGWEVV